MFRRALSILLCGCLLAGSLPATGFAAEEQAVEMTETTTENSGGGGYTDDAPAQLEEDADASEEAEDDEESAGQEKDQQIEEKETGTTEAETSRTEESEINSESKTGEDADAPSEETGTETEEATESEVPSESVTEETTEGTETQTVTLEEETDTEEEAVDSEGDETTTASFKNVQEGGYYIVAEIERPSTMSYAYVYWKETGSGEYKQYAFASGGRAVLYPTRPNTSYDLQLRSGTGDNAQVCDERTVTTSADYKFQTSVSVEEITTNSAKIKVTVTDYNGAYPSEDSNGYYTTLFAMTEYTNVQGGVQSGQGSGMIRSTSTEKGCTVTITLSGLQADKEYTLPVWISEYTYTESLKKKLDTVTFRTTESNIASKLKFEAAIDANDQKTINYTVSLDTTSVTDGLATSYSGGVFCNIKGAPTSEDQTNQYISLSSSNEYKKEGSFTGLYAGTEYELKAVVDGVVQTFAVSTGADGVTPAITLSPLSFGGKMKIELSGVSETSDSYAAKVYVKNSSGSWNGLSFKTKTDYNSLSSVDLTPENNYQGEWLIYSNSYYIGAGVSYEIRVDITKSDGSTIVNKRYLTLGTSAISLNLGKEAVAGRSATITYQLSEPDEYFDWINYNPYAYVYYREKGSESEWKRYGYSVAISKYKNSVELKELTVNTEYEVKVTSYADENVVYGTTTFQTTEGTEEGAFSDLTVQFSGFGVQVSGKYTSSDYADNTEIYFVETSSAGTVLAESKLSYSKSSKSIYVSDALRMETAKVQIKAVETLEEKDEEGNLVKKEYLSEEYIRENVPKDITFSISNAGAGVTTFHADLTYTGDMCLGNNSQSISAMLYYGTSAETSEEQTVTAYAYYSKNSSNTQILTFKGLTENTAYHGRLVVYVESRLSGSAVRVYEQEIKLDNFTTKENKTYPLESTFPDARLRELIVSRAGLGSSATEMTSAQLETITSLSANRSDFDTVAIKDLTGIDLLTELTSLYFNNNEISDTSGVDWSKLTRLSTLYLAGNELTNIPDLSKNTGLTYVYLNENLIPAEEFETVSAKLPDTVNLSSDVQASQRIGGLQVIAEETYYQRAGKSPLLIKVKGYKTGLPYTFRYVVDGTEVTLPSEISSSGEKIRCNTDTGITVGNHTLTVEMYQNAEKIFDKTVSFNMAEGGTFLEQTPYRFSTQQNYNSSMYVYVYSDKKISAAYMQKGDSTAARAENINSSTSNWEYRYKTLSNSAISLSGLAMYRNSISLQSLRYKSPDAGMYDLRVVYEDGTEETLQDVIEMIGKAYVQGGTIGYDYDSTGNFFYLSITGYGFDASKLEYAFTYNGRQQAAAYVNAKETSSGYIVKFRKDDTWMPKEGNRVQVKLTPKSGYDVVLNTDTLDVNIQQGIYYCAYNGASNKIEVGVTSNLRRENVAFKLSRYSSSSDASSDQNVIETIDLTSEVVTETISYLLPMKDGEVYKLPGGYYRVDLTCSDLNQYKTFYVSATSTNYWSGPQYVIEGAGDISFYYFTGIPFVSGNEEDFKAEIAGDRLPSPLNAKRIWTYISTSTAFTVAGMTFDMSSLAQGDYTVTLYYKDEKLSEHTVAVMPGEHFVMTSTSTTYPYASWIDESSFRVSIQTINTAASDEFTVSLTDIFGNKVEGLKTEVTNRYSDSVYLTVTGLMKADAYRYYYIYVTHNDLGEAYKPDCTTKFFADERGVYRQIYDNKFTWTTKDNRTVGIGMYSSIVFPVTVKIYKPYDTELITSLTINKGDLESNTSNPAWYYFKQSLFDVLPDVDALYDVVVIDSNGQTDLRSQYPLGLRDGVITTAWTVSPTQLNLSLDSEEAKTGIITVAGNTGTPVFKSENTNVATVAADSADKNKAVVTAVAEGTATITVTADDREKKVTVTVTKEPVKPTGMSITAPESAAAGSKVEINASVTPAGAWTQQSSITWSSSDSSVISIPAGSTGLVVEADALKAGSAVITAALDGTELKASCEILVENELSDDEQDEIVKELGTLYFLEGADDSLADIVLPDGWSWEDPALKPTADNSHPVQDFRASYNKDDISFERYLDVHVSKLDNVRIVGMSTVNSGKEALYTCAYTYIGADSGIGYETGWKWTFGQNLSAQTDTDRRITVKVSGDDILSVKMTVTNTTTGKTVSGDAQLDITAGEIPDSEPELENKKITIYKNSTLHVPIGLVAKDGNAITAVETDNADFKTEKDENGEWLIWLENGSSYTRKTSVKLSLTVATQSGTDYTKQLTVTVDVTEITAKNVKFKQTLKPNAAYSSTSTVTAEFTVSSKYIIEGITAVRDSEGSVFAVKSYDCASGTLVLEADINALNKDDKSYPARVDVKVRDYGTWALEIKVAVQNKKPSLKLGSAVILSGANANASVVLYNGKTEVSCRDYTVTQSAGDNVTIAQDGDRINVSYTGSKSGTYKVKVRKNTWASGVEVELKGKISVLDIAKAKLEADLPKVTINISEGYSAPVTIVVGIKGSSVSTDLTAAPAKDKDAQALSVEVLDGGKIRITPNPDAAKGNYKVAVSGSINGTAVKATSITVALTEKAPEVKLSAKGSINLANRDGTFITYTPTLKNLPSTLSIKSVRMDKTAADSAYFNVKLTSDSKAVMTAVTGKTMNAKTKYKPVLIFTLSNGKTLKTDSKFTVKVTNKLPKVSVTILSSALCSANAGHRAAYKLNAGNGYTISNVTTSGTNYNVTFDSRTDTVYVSLSDSADVKAGKKYTVPCTVYIKGADNATKPLTVKLKAVVY